MTPFACGNRSVELTIVYRQEDVELLCWAYKRARELARRMVCYRGDVAELHPQFATGSNAECVKGASEPVPIDAPDIAYSADDDKVLEEHMRRNGALHCTTIAVDATEFDHISANHLALCETNGGAVTHSQLMHLHSLGHAR